MCENIELYKKKTAQNSMTVAPFIKTKLIFLRRRALYNFETKMFGIFVF